MLKRTPLLGLSTNPNNILSQDGNLSAAINVHHDLSAISPAHSTAPQLIMDMPTTYTVIYQHRNDNYRNLILCCTQGTDKFYYWLDCTDSFPTFSASLLNTFKLEEETQFLKNCKNVIAVGNTLIFYTDTDIHYYLFSNEDGDSTYKYLGSKIPELDLSFTLKSHSYRALENEHSMSADNPEYTKLPNFSLSSSVKAEITDNNFTYNFTGQDESGFNECIRACISVFQNKFCNRYNYFHQPFFVRYALRLFDGSLTNHSAPILMIPSNKQNPVVNLMCMYAPSIAAAMPAYIDGSLYFDTVGVGCSLMYYLNSALSSFNSWKDIVKSVDIFVSEQIYTYNPANTISSMIGKYSASNSKITLGDFKSEVAKISSIGNNSGRRDAYNSFNSLLADLPNYASYSTNHCGWRGNTCLIWGYGNNKYKIYGNQNELDTPLRFDPSFQAVLPERTKDDFNKLITECNTFFLLKSIDLGRLSSSTTGTDITNDEYYLESIYNREVMSGELDSHHTIIPESICAYNNRINLANVKKSYFDGFPVSQWYLGINPSASTTVTPFVYIKKGGSYAVKRSGSYTVSSGVLPFYFFYPDPDAYKVILVYKSAALYKYKEYQLIEHSGLNGSYFYNSIDLIGSTMTFDSQDAGLKYRSLCNQAVANPWISQPNYIYTSEPANPFTFRASNIEQVGDGKIIAISPLALALSQEQFGSYPMAVFTTDGVWALSPNQTGGWQAVKPFTRDVLLNEDPSNILQLDRELLFATSRGLMLMAPSADGVQTECITDIFDGMPDKFNILTHATSSSSGSVQSSSAALPTGSASLPTKLDGYTYLINKLLSNSSIADFTLSRSTICPSFKEFIRNSRMLWDSAHQRIIIGNPNYKFSFVYNKADKLWTSVLQKILSPINSYPQCFANIDKKHTYTNLQFLTSESDDGDYPALTYKVMEQTADHITFQFDTDHQYDTAFICMEGEGDEELDLNTDMVFRAGDKFDVWYDLNGDMSFVITFEIDAEPSTYTVTKHLMVDFSRSTGSSTLPVITDERDAKLASDAVDLPHDGLIITRPFSIDDSDQLHTINTIIARGQFQSSHLSMVLLGSRNLTDWAVLGAVTGHKIVRHHGTPYKYFRLVIVTRLTVDECLLHFDTDYVDKLTNKLR